MSLESVDHCPICNSRQLTPFVKVIDHLVSQEVFTIRKCAQCSFLLTSPRPDTVSAGKYYQSDFYIAHTGGGTTIKDVLYRTIRKRNLRKRLDLIRQYAPNGKALLDYGCGTGEFLTTCAAKGWNTFGVEPSAEARKKIPEHIAVSPTIDSAPGKYDAITVWHVLEHVHMLNATIEALRNRLNNSGTIFIAVPNCESYDAMKYGPHWAAFDVPRHLWHFRKQDMISLLKKHQLTVTSIQPLKADAFYISLISEGYIRPTANLANMVRAFFAGLRSNLKAEQDNYSSLIYVARA